jgi:hypothetical protein
VSGSYAWHTLKPIDPPLSHQKVDRQGDELVKYVAAKFDNTVVVINSAGSVDCKSDCAEAMCRSKS